METKGQESIECLTGFLEYFKKNSGKVIVTFADTKLDMNITDKKKIMEDEMAKRVVNVKNQVRKLFKTLVDNFNGKDIPVAQIDFLGTLIHDFEFLPQNFLFQFEINRLEYTSFGALSKMNQTKSHMVILTLIILRVYVFRMVLKPWTDFKVVKKKELLSRNCYVVGSIMYEILMDYIKDRNFKIGQNQAHLPIEYKNMPRPLGPLITDRFELPEDPAEVRALRQLEEPVILGLEKREDLKAVIEDDKQFVQEMSDYLEEFADSIYDMVKFRY